MKNPTLYLLKLGDINMIKTIKGIYENGKIKVSQDDLPETNKKFEIIVVFLETDSNKREFKTEVPFSIADSGFFSLIPEHLGKTSAIDLDEIIAKEAIGRK